LLRQKHKFKLSFLSVIAVSKANLQTIIVAKLHVVLTNRSQYHAPNNNYSQPKQQQQLLPTCCFLAVVASVLGFGSISFSSLSPFFHLSLSPKLLQFTIYDLQLKNVTCKS